MLETNHTIGSVGAETLAGGDEILLTYILEVLKPSLLMDLLPFIND
jgi:hypothetical protein